MVIAPRYKNRDSKEKKKYSISKGKDMNNKIFTISTSNSLSKEIYAVKQDRNDAIIVRIW